jgi:8-oxo-dGTP pyrophosphatase MutT (NUDIX family)
MFKKIKSTNAICMLKNTPPPNTASIPSPSPTFETNPSQNTTMTSSPHPTTQYPATHFVESVGALPIKLSTREICLLHYPSREEYLLAKGRRNAGETRHSAALREVREETGFTCNLMPLTMTTRAPPAVEVGQCADEPRVHREAMEPFMLTVRQMEGKGVKVIWWYVAGIDECVEVERGEAQFRARLVGFREALELLTFEQDREVLREAIAVLGVSHASSATL